MDVTVTMPLWVVGLITFLATIVGGVLATITTKRLHFKDGARGKDRRR